MKGPDHLPALLLCLVLAACAGGADPVVAAPAPLPASNPDDSPRDANGDAASANGANGAVAPLAAPAGSEQACTAGAGNSAFDELFSLNSVKTIRVLISASEWDDLLDDYDANNRNEVYRIADVLYSDSAATDVRIDNVGFRVRGNTFSRERPYENGQFQRVHLKLKFNERFDEDESVYGSRNIPEIPANRGRLFRGVRSLNFKHNRHDQSYLRELFIFDVLHRFGVAGPRFAFARLYLKVGNGRERYFGVYHMFESLDSAWVRRRCGQNSFLFKCLYQSTGPADLARQDQGGDVGERSGAIGMEITDPVSPGAGNINYRPSYDLKTRDDDFLEAEAALNNLIGLLNSNTSQAQLEAMIDIPTLLKVQAVSALVGKWDGYWRNGNNYYMLLNPHSERWMMVPYDYDLTFDDDFFGYAGAVNLITEPFVDWGRAFFNNNDQINPVLMKRVMSIPAFRQMYLGYIGDLVASGTGLLDPGNARARLTGLSRLVAGHTRGYDAEADTEFSSDFSDITDFITARARVARLESGAELRRRWKGLSSDRRQTQ